MPTTTNTLQVSTNIWSTISYPTTRNHGYQIPNSHLQQIDPSFLEDNALQDEISFEDYWKILQCMDNRPQQGQDLVDRGNDLEIVRGEEIEGNIAGMLFWWRSTYNSRNYESRWKDKDVSCHIHESMSKLILYWVFLDNGWGNIFTFNHGMETEVLVREGVAFNFDRKLDEPSFFSFILNTS